MKKPTSTGSSYAGPLLKKSRAGQSHHRLVDEAGFYLLPMAVCTWAPRGQTPILRVPLTHDHLSAISGITFDGRLFLQVRPASYDVAAVVGFLRVLLRKISGKLVLIWDGPKIHRGHEIKDFLKRVELGNVCCANLEQLHQVLIRAKELLGHKKEIIKSCSCRCGYAL